MKKIVSALLVTISLLSLQSFAYEDVAQINTSQGIKFVPLHSNCNDSPMPTNSMEPVACNPFNEGCPPDTEPVAKYCWGGWGTGFYRCGFACNKIIRHDH
ncbi:hypothetical protein [Bdellovibrio sp. HCB-162]|uniref:hypothetical protein n=1 Tax=Bdellovibrio sp. HCB-162 TaxID=3394234 RepID=UPI0039BD0E43